jgi:hypothetical protein
LGENISKIFMFGFISIFLILKAKFRRLIRVKNFYALK